MERIRPTKVCAVVSIKVWDAVLSRCRLDAELFQKYFTSALDLELYGHSEVTWDEEVDELLWGMVRDEILSNGRKWDAEVQRRYYTRHEG